MTISAIESASCQAGSAPARRLRGRPSAPPAEEGGDVARAAVGRVEAEIAAR